jgi:hypothetical protein
MWTAVGRVRGAQRIGFPEALEKEARMCYEPSWFLSLMPSLE